MDASSFTNTRSLIHSLKLHRLKNKYNELSKNPNQKTHQKLYKIANKIKKVSEKKAKLIDYKKSLVDDKINNNLHKNSIAAKLVRLHRKAVASSYADQAKKLRNQATEYEKRSDIHLEKSIN